MRIAFVTEAWEPMVDGIVTRLQHTVTELVRRGHPVLVMAPTVGPARPGVVQRRTWRAVVPLIDRHRPWGLPDPRLRRRVESFGPSLVHVVNPVLMGSFAVRSLVDRYPVVASLHTDVAGYAGRYHLTVVRPVLRELTRAAYHQADVALATSPTGLELLADLGIHGASIWPPGIDTATFRRTPQREREPPAASPVRVLCVGRLAREKGLDQLRPMMDLAATSRHDVELTFVGDGPDRPRLERLFVGTPTVFRGVQRGSALVTAYRSADVLAFPSVTETVGLVLLEAAAVGLPVVATDTSAARDTLSGYSRAVLVPPKATAETWLQALEAAAQRGHEHGRPPDETARDWSHATTVLMDTYQSVIRRRRQASATRTGRLRHAVAEDNVR
jgi:glycosyltransferase involved in cell wall biosynthesis